MLISSVDKKNPISYLKKTVTMKLKTTFQDSSFVRIHPKLVESWANTPKVVNICKTLIIQKKNK